MANKYVFRAARVTEILRVVSAHVCHVLSIDSSSGRKNGNHFNFHNTGKPFDFTFFNSFISCITLHAVYSKPTLLRNMPSKSDEESTKETCKSYVILVY